MNTEWLKTASNEELFEQYAIAMNNLSKHPMFGVSWMQCKEELNLIKEEMLNRMEKHQ